MANRLVHRPQLSVGAVGPALERGRPAIGFDDVRDRRRRRRRGQDSCSLFDIASLLQEPSLLDFVRVAVDVELDGSDHVEDVVPSPGREPFQQAPEILEVPMQARRRT